MPADAVTAAARTSELRARVLSALVLAPAAVIAVWAGPEAFAGMVAAGGVILAREWTRMSDPDGPDLAFALAASGAAGGAIAASAGYAQYGLWWAAVLALGAAGVGASRGKAIDAGLGLLYVAVPCVALVWLRLRGGDVGGAQAVTVLFGAVWGADTGAYVAGKLIGGPRVLPSASPHKTWAGLIGGAIAGALGAALAAWAVDYPVGIATALAGGLVLAAAGLSGDLLESALKRRYGVKDSGSLIPGHGGLLDRVDGLMIAAVALAGFALFRMQFGGTS